MTYEASLKSYYEFKTNLMNFGKKNKYYFLINFNNIGSDATGDIYQLIHPFHFNEPGSIGDNQSAYNLLSLDGYTPNFKQSRTNFNNAELLSLNAIFKPNKKLKIKPLAFFNWDENNFFRNSVQSFNIDGTSFINTEDYKLRKKRFTGFGKIDVSYDISKTKTLKIISKYNNQNDKSGSQLLFNGDPTQENLKTNNELFDQKVTYTNKFKKHKVFLLTGRYINEKTPQTYSLNKFFYQELFPSATNVNNVAQTSENHMQFAGFEAHLMDRKKNGNLLELKLGNQYRKDLLTSTFSLKEDKTILDPPVDYQNNTSYSVNNLYFKSKYRLKIKQVAFIGKLDLNQLYNNLKQEGIAKQQRLFFINPSIGFDWEIISFFQF